MTCTLVWLRRDLRIADNPALRDAVQAGGAVVPVYVHAPEEAGDWADGSATRWWLHHSLEALDASLRGLGSRLILRRGDSLAALERLAREAEADAVVWNRLHEPALAARDARVSEALRARGLDCRSFEGGLLHDPGTVRTGAGGPFKVFTPFWRACQAAGLGPAPTTAPGRLPAPPTGLESEPLERLALRPRIPWDAGLARTWQPGEAGAGRGLDAFVEGALGAYAEGRDRPDRPGTSRLSPHLHFGELSPRQVLWAVRGAADARGGEGWHRAFEKYAAELGWREFAHHVLHHFPHTPARPLDARFEQFPWRDDGEALRTAWERGRTGVPLVDAGMRELWETGWMHNRVRMVVASFLTKNCLVPWRAGARWFWDTLVDADLANNTLGWQWAAGCGADAAPYFRIFNPVLQGQRFDPEGAYVARWVPELAALPARWRHRPWAAPAAALRAAGVVLGRTYPEPVVDLRQSREAALAAYQRLVRG